MVQKTQFRVDFLCLAKSFQIPLKSEIISRQGRSDCKKMVTEDHSDNLLFVLQIDIGSESKSHRFTPGVIAGFFHSA